MSSQNMLYRILFLAAIAGLSAAPASAQTSEPEFVPYVNDLQLFDQPDLSPYGQGVAVPSGWFGTVEYLNWTPGHVNRAPVGQPGVLNVITPGAATVDSGDTLLTPVTGSILLASNVVTVSGVGTVVTNTFQTFAFTFNFGGNTPSTQPNGNVTQGAIGQINSLDNAFMTSENFSSGGRVEFGRVDEDGRGWMVSGFGMAAPDYNTTVGNASVNFANSPIGFVDFRGVNTLTPDGIDDDLDHDGVYGRFGADFGSDSVVGNPPFILQGAEPLDGVPDLRSIPTDFDDAVRLPTKFVSLTLQDRTTTGGIELSRLWRLAMGPRGGVWELFFGPRSLYINDRFSFAGVGQAGSVGTEFYTNAQNLMIAGQLGGRWSRQLGRVQASIEGRAFAGVNYQHVTQQGEIGSVGFGVGATQVINVQLPARFASTVNQTEFVPGAELRLNLKYQVFRSMYLQGGYSAMFVDNVARGSMMTQYSLPSMGILADRNESTYLLYGLNLGLVINR